MRPTGVRSRAAVKNESNMRTESKHYFIMKNSHLADCKKGLSPTSRCFEDDASMSSLDDNQENDGTLTNCIDGHKSFHAESRSRKFAVFCLAIGTVLLFADQNLMSPNLTSIAEEFGFDELERDRKLGGDIALAFFVLGAPASLIIGCLADTVNNRSRLYAMTIILGEGSCLLTYWIRTYTQLYISRAITGISVGGALPLVFSILGDLYPADQRHKVSSLVGIGVGAGISVGQGVAGFLGPRFGWRLPFVIVSVPAIVCALVVWLFVQEPERGASEEVMMRLRNVPKVESDEPPNVYSADQANISTDLFSGSATEERLVAGSSGRLHRTTENGVSSFGLRKHLETFRSLLRTPTVVLALLQGAPGCIPWGITNVFLADFLSENRGMSVEFATIVLLVFGLGNFLGLLLGGFWGSSLYAIDKRYPSLLAGAAAALGAVPFWFLLNVVFASTSFFLTFPLSILSGFMAGITGPIAKATLQNVTKPDGRGQAFALYNTFDDFGRGLGPVFVAMMVSTLGGRTQAFNVGTSGWVLCGLLNGCMYFFVKKDEETMQAKLAASVDEESGLAMQLCNSEAGFETR